MSSRPRKASVAPSAWRGAAFDRPKLKRCYRSIGFARLILCWQAAPANVS
jgi:hypothetical protein